MTSPLGDQRGWVLNPPCVSRRTLVPSASITKTCAGPARSETKAISRPVGDQLGSVSIAALLVSRRSAPVERLRTYTSGLPSLSLIHISEPTRLLSISYAV